MRLNGISLHLKQKINYAKMQEMHASTSNEGQR